MIGASHVATILGVNPFCARETTCLTNMHKSEDEKENLESGKRMEPIAIKAYLAKWRGTLAAQSNEVRDADHLPIRGICDIFMSGKLNDQRVNCVVEVKTSKTQRRTLLHNHFIQVVAYMEIYDAHWGEVVLYHNTTGSMKLFFIKPSILLNIELRRLLQRCSKELMQGYLLPLSKSDLTTIRKKIRDEMQRCIVLVNDEKQLLQLRQKHSEKLRIPLRAFGIQEARALV